MDSQKLKQLVKELSKKLTSWDWQKAVNNSGNETTTREFLHSLYLVFDCLFEYFSECVYVITLPRQINE